MLIEKNGLEFKTAGHVDKICFAIQVSTDYQLDVPVCDIKHGYERMTFKRNRNQTKPGEIYFKRCAAYEFGANPVTFVRIK